MPRLTFPITPDGLQVDVVVGLDAARAATLSNTGRAIPAPRQARALIDTGTTMTGVVPRLLNAVGVSASGAAQTLTATGLAAVQFFLISLTVFDSTGASGNTFFRGMWRVTDLPYELPDVDVLLGLDFIREIVLTADGPGARFMLDF
jgi:hypothetical protein